MLSASGNLFKCHEEVLYLPPLIPPKCFDIFPPITGGCSEGLGAFWFFFKDMSNRKKSSILPFPALMVVRHFVQATKKSIHISNKNVYNQIPKFDRGIL